MKRLALSALVFSGLFVGSATAATTHTVTIGRDSYSPPYLRIDPGDTVTWRNADSQIHTATALPGGPGFFATGALRPGQEFSQTFTRRGRYGYVCAVHLGAQRGVVQVGPDTVKPKLSKLSVRATPRLLTARARLSEDARFVMTLRRDGKPVRTVRAGPVGEGTFTFTFRLKGTALLASGRYRATVEPRDLAGNRGRAVSAAFRVQ